ncbi:MAG: Fic family protein [Gammaproteobacteria bacterium HGW-Gammaproteobacteria-1]|jgi:Fic family protein|nr:MAG: Fic family protein [Gammaproteobacteria bacterium HGW-Gammaproteobacteria-1]
MKSSDLCPARQQRLVDVPEYPGAKALVPPLTPRWVPASGAEREIARAHEALGALKALAVRLPNPDLIARTLDRREAVRSSQLEGTQSDVNDLLAYEATGSGEGLPADVGVTLNYVRALGHGLAQVRSVGGPEALKGSLIKGCHKRLMEGVEDYKGVPGEYRHLQNWIGGFRIYDARFVPPPPEQVQGCMDDLEAYLRHPEGEDQQMVAGVVLRMAIAHAQFETIHPFVDGNGRTGRILMPLMLAAEGYPPVYLAGFLKANQRAYHDALLGVQLRDEWEAWVGFLAEGVTVAAQEAIGIADELVAIQGRWQQKVAAAGIRADAAINKLPELLIGAPVVTVNQVKEYLGISFPAANNALALLERMGVLALSDRQKRNRVFVAKEVIDVLEQPSAGAKKIITAAGRRMLLGPTK